MTVIQAFFIQFVNAILRQRCGFTYNNGFIALSFEPNTLFETSIVSSKILKTSSQKPDKKIFHTGTASDAGDKYHVSGAVPSF